MATIINPVITDAGLAAARNASSTGVQLAITHVCLGTGQYTPANPNTQTAMVARKEKVTIAGGFATTTGIAINVLFPAWAGTPNPYNATEISFYAGDPDAGGVLFAVYSQASGVIVQRNALEFVAQFGLALSRVPAGSVTVTLDPSGALALALIGQHEAKADPHTQYFRTDGDTATGPVKLQGTSAAPTPLLIERSDGGVGFKDWYLRVENDHSLAIGLASDLGIPATELLRITSNGIAKFKDAIKSMGTKDVPIRLKSGDALPTSDIGPIWHDDYAAWMTWQVFNANGASYTGYASVNVGSLLIDTTPVTRSGHLRSGASGYPATTYAALYHWAVHNGVIKSSAAGAADPWTPGTVFYGISAANTLSTPDVRGEHPRFYDDGRGVDAGRAFGTWQDSAVKAHSHIYYASENSIDGSAPDVERIGGYQQAGYTTSTTGIAENRVRTSAFAAYFKF